MSKKVLISTDPGIDDLLALMLAAKRRDAIEIAAVNASHGNVAAERAFRNALAILEALRYEPFPILAKGSDGPAGAAERKVHGEDGLGGIGLAPVRGDIKAKETSALVEEALGKGVDTLISIAPLTDIAGAFRKNRSLAGKIKSLFIMGGALRSPGSINGYAEFNFYSDPGSADLVLNSGVRDIVLVSFDVTTKVVLREPDLERFKAAPGAVYRMAERAAAYYIDFCKRRRGAEGAYMHDPLTVGLAIDESLCEYEELCLGVDCKKEPGRLIAKKGRPNVRFAVKVDAGRFLKMFFESIL